MRSVVALCAVLAAVLVASPALAEKPLVVAATDPAAQAPGLSGPQASDAALPPAIGAPAQAEQAAPLAPPEPTLFANIDLTSQTMTVSDKNGAIASWKISSARGGYRTPTGTYTPHYTSRMHYSKQYHFSPMPYSVFFNEGVAVHGTGDLRNLGRPASHGCVRSHPKNAKVFYDLVQKHGMQMTRVTVSGKPPYSPAVADGPRRRRYAQPAYQPFNGFFGYQQAYQPKVKKAKKKQYGGSYNTW
ncbi:L,D-transpeptidase [Hyphomicrobium album]|nr:L,D-transpeptidase [Hyphomicrobium album]